MNAVLVSKVCSKLTSGTLRAFSTSRTALAEAPKAPSGTKKAPASATATAPAPITVASNEYVSKDFFGYDAYSYFDIESEMVKFRLPQPSALPKNEFTYSKVLTPQQKAKANL